MTYVPPTRVMHSSALSTDALGYGGCARRKNLVYCVPGRSMVDCIFGLAVTLPGAHEKSMHTGSTRGERQLEYSRQCPRRYWK